MPSKEQLEKYADILIRIGLHVQPEQPVSIDSPIESAEFARLLMNKAYEAGASTVDIEWVDPLAHKIRLQKETDKNLVKVPNWIIQRAQELIDNNAAFLNIAADNPDLLADVDPKRIAMFHKAVGEKAKNVQQYFMEDRVTWLVCSLPTQDWAQKMFPEESATSAVDKLWEAIFKVMRMDAADPVAAWENHIETLDKRAKWLNDLNLKKLHYRAPGTDLTIELSHLHTWIGASSVNEKGTRFVANLPTEEVFTLPKRNGVNGTVRSTMPLAYGGVVIEGMEFTFKEGRITDFSSKTGYETLKGLVDTDEGSHYLGEIALVPNDSPISNLNTLFYNTLFDENASCHMAIGKAYPTCLNGGKEMSEDELLQHGVNDSITHVDFMMGTSELDIDGETQDGKTVAIFRQGNWA
ncbi:aminopeptidase [Alicyclobacillus sp. SO9]|uniref:aminopeptidase n=1 Tax=Alicyclobacillus sp. SO9 TaxID=2665646 RepID=UPI0018E8961D|nr:aminopeptidase [Alicyclobacillus sp. SO9]QQE77414.1 aminopeptidase [Alicyclobacillus sp. SO9]